MTTANLARRNINGAEPVLINGTAYGRWVTLMTNVPTTQNVSTSTIPAATLSGDQTRYVAKVPEDCSRVSFRYSWAKGDLDPLASGTADIKSVFGTVEDIPDPIDFNEAQRFHSLGSTTQFFATVALDTAGSGPTSETPQSGQYHSDTYELRGAKHLFVLIGFSGFWFSSDKKVNVEGLLY